MEDHEDKTCEQDTISLLPIEQKNLYIESLKIIISKNSVLGPIIQIMDKTAEIKKENNIRLFINLLSAKVTLLQKQADAITEKIEKYEHFQNSIVPFSEYFERVIKEWETEKIPYYASMFLNNLAHTDSKINFQQKKLALENLESLTVVDIEILLYFEKHEIGFLYNVPKAQFEEGTLLSAIAKLTARGLLLEEVITNRMAGAEFKPPTAYSGPKFRNGYHLLPAADSLLAMIKNGEEPDIKDSSKLN